MTKHKSMLLMLMAAGLLTVAVTACHDDLDETDRQAMAGEGRGVVVKGFGFYEAAPFVEDTVTEHRPTLTTNVDDYVPDMDVVAYDTLDMAEMAAARRASEKAMEKGYSGNSIDELMRKPSLATKLKQRQEARARARRASAGKKDNSSSEGRVVAGHKPLVPVPHRETAEGGKTRSYDTSDSTALFVMGDSVGVYEVDAVGNVVKANVKFYYDAGLWNSETVMNYHEGHRYFAYHPYRTDAQLSDMGMTVDATATDHVNFFKTFWENWPVSDDQGVFEKYHACDFLAGEATWIEEKHELNFAMYHMMGMLQLEFGIARYYLDWAVSHRDSFPYWWTDTVTTTLKNNMKFLQKFDRKHRRITRPGSALSVIAIDNTWNLTFLPEKSITRGHYQHYDIGRTTGNTENFYQIFYNQLGDILLKDGRLVHRHDHWRLQANDPVGIVVGTVYPSINPIPSQYAVVGPVEDETYNTHSLERDYLYDMQVIHSEGNEDKGMKVMRARFVRCLIMSLKDLEPGYDSGTGIYFPASWGACWSWNEAFAHFPNTHVVGAPANNVWSSKELKSRVNNYWYPDISGWHAKTACENFNDNAGHVNTGGAYSKDSRQYTPNSGWFIGTAGQYQVAFCFGRVRHFCDSWKSWDGPDDDGAEPVRHYYEGAWWYQPTYKSTKRIGTSQGSETYYDWDEYSLNYNNYTHHAYSYWYPSGDSEHNNPLPTMYHDWDRINNAMSYAVGSTGLYNKLSGEYWTTTLFCDISQNDRFFPSANRWWDFDKKYWNYHSWNSFVTVHVNASNKTRGSNYWLDYRRNDWNPKVRPLMAL